MSQHPTPFRLAMPSDIEGILPLAISTVPGFVETLWSRLAHENEPADAFGRRVQNAFIDEENTIVADINGQIAAMLVSFMIAEKPNPFVQEIDEMLVPVMKLYSKVPGVWYIHGIAAAPEFQGRGLSSKLMELAEERAIAAGVFAICLLVVDTNQNAIRFYEKRGYAVTASEPFVGCGADTEATQWLLMNKTLPRDSH
ncbi:GNAT family N-acetyltransferase [Ruegeria arenilitoris]|uniref:GNAT family N-acetyltransferase n=1 Tax=Ruegeria arenilitoris TaxID=1173585 RepID=UPI00147B356B|nr:GNAT family N-acetyltransferase [Ruegeria arenilitoris]